MKLIAGDWNVEHNGRQLNLVVDNDVDSLEDLDIEPVISCLETIFSTAKALTELTSVGIPESGLERKDEDALTKLQKKDGTREGEVYIRILAIGGYTGALLTYEDFTSLFVETEHLQSILSQLEKN